MDNLNIGKFSKLVTMTGADATAIIRGEEDYANIAGTVNFYNAANGTLVVAEVFNLPLKVLEKGIEKSAGPFYAFHIHSGKQCGSGDDVEPFMASGSHYNPENRPHPMHAGDLPPLLSDRGYAYSTVYTSRFTPDEIVGRTVIVHANPDDFKTQPSGGAGLKLACGEIKANQHKD